MGVRRRLLSGLLLSLLALAVAACGGDGDTAARGNPNDLREAKFEAVSLKQDGSSVPLVGPVALVFEGRRVDLITDCNGAGGRVEISEGTLDVSTLIQSLAGCSDELEAQDEVLTDLLQAGPSWSLSGDRLVLSSDETVLTLKESA